MLGKGISLKNVRNRVQPMVANNLAEGGAMLANSLPESGAIRKPREFLEVSQTTSPRICDNLKCSRICAVTDTSTRLSPAQLAFGFSE
jgi:hypothetical protein